MDLAGLGQVGWKDETITSLELIALVSRPPGQFALAIEGDNPASVIPVFQPCQSSNGSINSSIFLEQ
jgi:hypothetical protein